MTITPASFAQSYGVGVVELGRRGADYVARCFAGGTSLAQAVAASIALDGTSFTFVPSPQDRVSDDLQEDDLPGTGRGVAFFEAPTAFLAATASEQHLALVAEARMLFPDREPHEGEPLDREFTMLGSIYLHALPPISVPSAEEVIDWGQCWAMNLLLTRAVPELALPSGRAGMDSDAVSLVVEGTRIVASLAFDSMGLVFARTHVRSSA